MIVAIIKRVKEEQQHYKAEKWDYNSHQLDEAHYEKDYPGYLKQEMENDMKSASKKLKKFAGVIATEWQCFCKR
tara:strand:+ start:632 stop:853 length:222 start_codon:yes stop_codon:yes gene_type:complete